jgi:phosphatidylinositol alpha-1,6-mannosyltransferase
MTAKRNDEFGFMAVLVTNDFPPHHGGIQRMMSHLARELQLQGTRVVVVAPQIRKAAAFDRAQAFRISRYLDLGRLIGFASMTITLFIARLREKKSFTIASMWFPAGLAACIVPRAFRGRLGVLAHGTEIAPQRRGVRRRLMHYVFKRADVIIANSAFTRGLLEQAGIGGPISVVHPGIDAQRLVVERSSVPTLLSVGRLVARKGFDRTIAALPAVLEQFPTAHYEIVGCGPQRAELEALAKRLNVEDHVVFLGPVDDEEMQKAYSRAWVFALPVRAIDNDVEGFGVVYLEAAMAELPCIGGLASGAEDAIAADETGLLVDGESSTEVAAAAIALFSNPMLARAMGVRARERALAHFTWTRFASDILKLVRAGNKAT